MTIQHLKRIINKLKEFLSFYSLPGLVLNTGDVQMHKIWILPWKTFRLKSSNMTGISLQDYVAQCWVWILVQVAWVQPLWGSSIYLLVVWSMDKISTSQFSHLHNECTYILSLRTVSGVQLVMGWTSFGYQDNLDLPWVSHMAVGMPAQGFLVSLCFTFPWNQEWLLKGCYVSRYWVQAKC